MAAPPRLRAAVAGATGYIGIQCVEMLARHPHVELVRLLARTHAGRRFSEVVPGSRVDLQLDPGLDVDGVDLVLAALPHTVAASHARGWVASGAVVVDMSADFRLRDARTWSQWYRLDHPDPELCASAVYALPELPGRSLTDASLLAVPGCYPTAALLACVPALAAGLVEPDLVVDAKSGVSGSGRSPTMGVHFAEVNESVHAYGVDGHRHKAEMLQELRLVAGGEVQLTFVPHLVPMTRGILATAYLRPRPGVTASDIEAAYAEFCDGHPCLRLDPQPPATKSVTATNVAALHAGWQDGMAVITCAVDNLVKGAGGQGLQALNLRFGYPETAGLQLEASWP